MLGRWRPPTVSPVCGALRSKRASGTESRWGRHLILRALNDGQVIERVGGYGGSNKLFSVERDPLTEEQLLQSLLLIQRSLHPQVGRSRAKHVLRRLERPPRQTSRGPRSVCRSA